MKAKELIELCRRHPKAMERIGFTVGVASESGECIFFDAVGAGYDLGAIIKHFEFLLVGALYAWLDENDYTPPTTIDSSKRWVFYFGGEEHFKGREFDSRLEALLAACEAQP